MKDESEYCPLCGAHQLEWGQGEASDETLLEQEKEIEELLKKCVVIREGDLR